MNSECQSWFSPQSQNYTAASLRLQFSPHTLGSYNSMGLPASFDYGTRGQHPSNQQPHRDPTAGFLLRVPRSGVFWPPFWHVSSQKPLVSSWWCWSLAGIVDQMKAEWSKGSQATDFMYLRWEKMLRLRFQLFLLGISLKKDLIHVYVGATLHHSVPSDVMKWHQRA